MRVKFETHEDKQGIIFATTAVEKRDMGYTFVHTHKGINNVMPNQDDQKWHLQGREQLSYVIQNPP